MDRSIAEERKLAIDHVVGFMLGSSRRYERRSTGVEVEMRVGSVEVKKVIGSKWNGGRYGVDRVRIDPRRLLGSSEEGVRIRRVRAASTGESSRAAMDAAAVEMSTVATGEVDAKIEVSGMADVLNGISTSGSAIPKSAARKPRTKVSMVRARTL